MFTCKIHISSPVQTPASEQCNIAHHVLDVVRHIRFTYDADTGPHNVQHGRAKANTTCALVHNVCYCILNRFYIYTSQEMHNRNKFLMEYIAHLLCYSA